MKYSACDSARESAQRSPSASFRVLTATLAGAGIAVRHNRKRRLRLMDSRYVII